MKYGFRTPSVKKSVKARTTGKAKRAVKKSINPMYGKKGMGVVNNPKKAIYNKVYNKTTFGAEDVYNAIGKGTNKSTSSNKTDNSRNNTSNAKRKRKKVNVPIGEHPTTKGERIFQTIFSVILFILATLLILWLFSYFSVAFRVILILICFLIMVYLIIEAWKRTITVEYKTVYEDELTKEDKDFSDFNTKK